MSTDVTAAPVVEAPVVAPEAPFAVSKIHELLDAAEVEYHKIFQGHVPDEVNRFGPHLDTVRMVVDQSSDSASKEA